MLASKSKLAPCDSQMPQSKAARERRKARSIAVQALYEADSSQHPLKAVTERLIGCSNLSDELRRFVIETTQGISDRLDQLDIIIGRYAPAWPVEELAIIDRNILRIATYELMFNRETPPKAVVNEAVELAKLFGSEASPRFVNGVLGSVLREMSRQPLEKDTEYVS